MKDRIRSKTTTTKASFHKRKKNNKLWKSKRDAALFESCVYAADVIDACKLFTVWSEWNPTLHACALTRRDAQRWSVSRRCRGNACDVSMRACGRQKVCLIPQQAQAKAVVRCQRKTVGAEKIFKWAAIKRIMWPARHSRLQKSDTDFAEFFCYNRIYPETRTSTTDTRVAENIYQTLF